jgi:PAS domain S-box-containing protein
MNDLMRARDAMARMERQAARQRQIEQDLRESESRFRNLVEQSMVGAYIIQDDLFRYVNKEFAGIFGYTVSEIIGVKHPADLVLPEDVPMVEREIASRMAGDTGPVQHAFRGRKKDGQTVYVEACGVRTVEQHRPAVLGTSWTEATRRIWRSSFSGRRG